MASSISPTLKLHAWGDLACFTRPTQKVERVTFEVPTPSAVRGLLEAILWKPAIRWHVKRIHVLKPIRFISFRRNEVERRAASVPSKLIKNGGATPQYFADKDRAQRNTVALRDVDYVFEAAMELTDRAGPGDNMTKFVDMFERRVCKGQYFHQPYFGCREMVAHFGPVTEEIPPAIEENRDLGVMLWDIDFSPKGHRPRHFRARLDRGVLAVPTDPESTLEPTPS